MADQDTRLTSQPAQSDLVEAIKAIETALIEPDAAGAMAIVQQILADREAALSTPTAPQPDRDSVLQKIEQEYQWGNLTKVGVVNYLRRSGFNFNAAVRHAERIVPTMTDKLTQSAEVKDNLPIGCVVGTGSGTAMCSRGQPHFGGDCIYPKCEDLTHPTTDTQSDAVRDIARERKRQIDDEGWSLDRDDRYADTQLAGAAACYVLSTVAHWAAGPAISQFWPWDDKWWKPDNARRNLVKAGALIAAEIERLDRAAIRNEAADAGEGS